ncbi:MAG: response regulator [Armatimonadetes bacterium]|nr:response regulator [Armatimonadota bacterium]
MHRKRVFLVDDSLVVRQMVRDILTADGTTTVVGTAEDGEEALRKIPEARPDLVLLDILMPKLAGDHVLQRMKQDPRLREIPVIILTCQSGGDEVAKGLDAGADDYITKPFDPVELLARIRACLRMRALQQEVVEQQRKLAAAETLKQLLMTLSHHINNAAFAIATRAELCALQGPEAGCEELITVCQHETKRIQAVLEALQDMVVHNNVRTKDIPGLRQRILDIEEHVRRACVGPTA